VSITALGFGAPSKKRMLPHRHTRPPGKAGDPENPKIQATGDCHHPPSASTFPPGSQYPAMVQKQLFQIESFNHAAPFMRKSSLKNKSKIT